MVDLGGDQLPGIVIDVMGPADPRRLGEAVGRRKRAGGRTPRRLDGVGQPARIVKLRDRDWIDERVGVVRADPGRITLCAERLLLVVQVHRPRCRPNGDSIDLMNRPQRLRLTPNAVDLVIGNEIQTAAGRGDPTGRHTACGAGVDVLRHLNHAAGYDVVDETGNKPFGALFPNHVVVNVIVFALNIGRNRPILKTVLAGWHVWQGFGPLLHLHAVGIPRVIVGCGNGLGQRRRGNQFAWKAQRALRWDL